MHTSRFILFSLSILACFGTETVSDTTYDESNNFDGLVFALKALDYGSVPSFSSRPAKNSSNGCAVTVSTNESFRNPTYVVIC